MSKIHAALVAMTALMAGPASADPVRVVTLTELHEPGQPAQLQGAGGDCRYYGSVDEPTTILIEVSVCSKEDGTTEEAPYHAVAKISGLPVPAGTLVDLTK